MREAPSAPAEQDRLLALPSEILADVLGEPVPSGAVRPVYQPIVDLTSMDTIGFEALTRGPAGSALEAPLDLFAAVRRGDRLRDFDRACRDAALAGAIRGGVDPPLTVFVNVEPEMLEDPDRSVADDHTWVLAPEDLRCVIEITERDLTARPAALLHAIAEVRERSWGVALDDVGADPASLALMAVLRPDVIKLDMRVVQQRPDRAVAEVVAAVNAQAEETGAVVLAEGIETEAHVRTALALGATLGQGFRFGRPEDLPPQLDPRGPAVPFLGSGLHPTGPTPFALVRATHTMRRADGELVRSLIEHLEELALRLGPATVVLAGVTPERFDSAHEERLAVIGAQAALVGIAGVPRVVRHGLRGSRLRDGDPLAEELALTVLAPHFAAALVAREVGGGGGGDEPAYEFAVTHQRELVAACSRALAARIDPED